MKLQWYFSINMVVNVLTMIILILEAELFIFPISAKKGNSICSPHVLSVFCATIIPSYRILLQGKILHDKLPICSHLLHIFTLHVTISKA